MLQNWGPWKRSKQPNNPYLKRNSLVRMVLVILLVTSLFPVLLLGTLTIFRSRDMLRSQVSSQMENMIHNELSQIRQYINTRESLMERLAVDEVFQRNLNNLLNSQVDTPEYIQARSSVFVEFSIYFDYRSFTLSSNTQFFDELFIMRPDGEVLISTNSNWLLTNFGAGKIRNAHVLELVGTNGTTFVYNNDILSTNPGQMLIFSTRSFTNEGGEPVATMVAVGTTPLVNQTLNDAAAFFKGARGYLITPERFLIGPAENESVDLLPDEPEIEAQLRPLVKRESDKIFFSSETANDQPVVIFAQWIPEYNIGLALEVPERSIYSQIRVLDGFNLVVLALAITLSGILIYIATRGVVTPLVYLSNVADSFAKGNWTERAAIERNDEIGLLAASFNHMADQLSELYHSLEEVVEKRTSQLRTASEVAQLATSTTRLDEVLSSTAKLVVERFNYYHVAIYLMDEAERSVVLTEASGAAENEIKQRATRLTVGPDSLIGWVAANNQPRIIPNVLLTAGYQMDPLLPITRSEAAIPISLGKQVLGVLDIQSVQEDAFDDETVSVLQTLANQISSTLQSSRLLQTTQLSYQETSLLYRATRQVTTARTEDEIIQILSDSFIQLPYVSMVLNVQQDQFKVSVLTDYKSGQVDRNLSGISIPVRDMGRMLTENRINLIDIGKPSEFDNIVSFLFRRGCRTAALLSVVESGKLSKVLVIGSREADRITYTSLQPYVNLAEVIGAALEKFTVLSTLQHRLSELQILANFSQAISAEIALQQLFRVLHEQVMQTLGDDINFAVAIFNKEKSLVEIPYRYENGQIAPPVQPFPLGEGLTSYVLQNRKPLLITRDAERTAIAMGAKVVGKPAKSWMGIPLIYAGQITGALIVQDEDKEDRFSDTDVNLFMTLAPQIANAIYSAQLLTETQQALKAYDQEHFLLNSLLDHSPNGISFKDLEGRYLRVSKSYTEIYQTDPESMIGKTDLEVLDEETAAQFIGRQKMLLASGQPASDVIQMGDPEEGQERWYWVSGTPIFQKDNTPYGFLFIQSDITDLKQAENLAQRRSENLVTAAEIARETSGSLDVETVLKKSVNLVRERFGFYHASIFLLDPQGEYAVLRESTGIAGETMMRNGHRLAVGSKSIVGQVTASAQPLVVNDVLHEPTHYANPLLPETRSELAIPLKVGEHVLGALDVQSDKLNAFNSEDVNILQILADQLAIALINGELYAKTQELLKKYRMLREVSLTAGSTTTVEDTLLTVVRELRAHEVADRMRILLLNESGQLQTLASSGFEGIHHLDTSYSLGEGIVGAAAAEKRTLRVGNTGIDQAQSELVIPIMFNNELLGVLELQSEQEFAFDENDEEILSALGNNLGVAIANIRLVNQVSQQVERERMLFEITSKIRRSVDLNTILQTSTREICRAIGARRARIHITAADPISQPRTLDSQEDLNSSNGHKNGREAK